MSPELRTAVRSILGTMTSDSKCDEVVRVVLGVMREPTEAALDALEDEILEALKSAESWLDRWAVHVGICRGGDVCACGLTLVRSEAGYALASHRASLDDRESSRDEPPSPPTKDVEP